MRFFLALLLLSISGCVSKYTISDFNPHSFSDDVSFIKENLNCENTFYTDKINTANNEIFRCSAESSNVFFTIESNGNNAEDLKSASVLWKQWRADSGYKESRTKAQQFIAVFARLYAKDHQLELVDAFFNNEPAEFSSHTYKIKTSGDVKQFYTIHKAIIKFK